MAATLAPDGAEPARWPPATAEAPLPVMREAFDLPRDVVWMNCAQMSAQHHTLVEAAEIGMRRKSAPWNSPAPTFFEEIETSRALFAELIGASADDVALTPSASYGIATAAKNLKPKAGQTIILYGEQFPSNVYSWLRLAEETGARIVTVQRAPDDTLTGPLLEAIGPETAIVAAAAVHWADATPIDLKAVREKARSVGAALVLDLTQSLGAVPFSVAEIDPDFVACPLYKWMLGPYTCGFLYVAPRHQNGTPLEETWMNRKDAVNFSKLVQYTDEYAPGARRFDMGAKANFALAPVAIASLRLVHALQPARIAATLSQLNDRLIAALAERGFAAPIAAARSPHFFGVRLPAHAPDDLGARLAADKVFVSVRGEKMRIAPHVWVDGEDEARFLAAVDRHLS